MTNDSPQNMTKTAGFQLLGAEVETEDLQLPNELVYEPLVRTVDRHDTANHLAIYVLRRWKRTISKFAFRPPVRYLEPLCSMPVDIFYEILEHLHPIDLYHISQANRAFQKLLSHPNSSSAWNLAFENDPGLPKCPPVTTEFPTKMTGLEWAAMLFGKYICQQCGDGGALPNISFRYFQCSDCEYDLVDLVDGIDEESVAFTLVKKSRVLQLSTDGRLLNTDGQWYIYSEAEVHAVHDAVTGYEDAIKRKEPGAREAFDAYKTKRKAEADLINEHSATCLRWVEELQKCYDIDLGRRISNTMKRIRSRLKREGHHPEDVEKATFQITFFNNAPRLSNRQWETFKDLLEPVILRAKNERVAHERGILINKRKEFVHELYREYKKSVPPLTWAYLPPHYVVYQFKPFAELIDAPHDDELNREDCEDALRCLPKEIDDWTLGKKTQLVSLLPGRGNGSTDSQPQPDAGATLQEPVTDFEALHLATSVFCCLGSNISRRKTGLCLIGWKAAGPHLRCSALENYWENRLHFSQRGHDAATALVNLACLDPRTAATTDMDRLDYRYICTSCPIVAFSGFQGREAYNWRDAVLHYIKKADDTQAPHPSPTWSLLTAEAEADIKRREEHDPYTTEPSWSCALCPEHFKNMVPRKEAIKHVKSKHNIPSPVENTDYFYLITRDDRTLRRQAGFPQSPPSEYTCTHCVSRLHNMKCILRHLRRSHQVADPVAERDWVRVQTVLRSTLPMPLLPPNGLLPNE